MSFFQKKIDFISLKQVADLTSSIVDPSYFETQIKDIKSISTAENGDITFYYKAKYEKFLSTTKATACIVSERDVSKLPKNIIPVISKEPYLAFTSLLKELYGLSEFEKYPRQIATSAQIAASAQIGKNVSINENVVISENVTIEEGAVIMANTFIGAGVKIGTNTVISDNCSIMFTHIGADCIIRSGARIGTCGFGFIPDLKAGKHLQIPQIAGVIIGNSVDIGANTTIDRGALENTVIEDNVKIDNLVQIAHGVKIGASSFLVSQSGVAGSTVVGKGCVIGAQSGVTDNIEIANFTRCIARSGIANDIKISGQELAGAPAIPKKIWFKMQIKLKKLISKND